MIRFHATPLTRTETCETHGPYEAKCFVGDTWTRCPTCEADREAEKQREAVAKAREARLLAFQTRIGQSGIPDRFRDRTLAVFESKTDDQRQALMFARRYADDFERVLATGRSAIFVGRPGTGKTHLASGIGIAVMERGHTVLFTTVMRAIRRVKDTWVRESRETESQAVAALVAPDLLILDEVGVQFGSEFEKNLLFDVLNERYERRRPTLMLSNIQPEDLVNFLGERVIDRLREDGGKIIPFTWESHRKAR